MKLRLELKNPASFSGARSHWVLQAMSMVIGRSAQADWVLPDPERIISKQHCRIEQNGDRFVIVDMSVNGMSMNGLPVNRGVPQPLESGAVLRIGRAVVEVTIDRTPAVVEPAGGHVIPQGFIPTAGSFGQPIATVPAAAPVLPSAPVPAAPQAFSADGPFGNPQAMPASGDAVGSAPPLQAVPPSGAVLENWWKPDAKPPPASDGSAETFPAAGSFESPEVISGQDMSAMLLQRSGSISATQLAVLVGKAAQILPQEQRNELLKRLDELVQEAAG